jgi:Protein of unknown function (DUF3261)
MRLLSIVLALGAALAGCAAEKLPPGETRIAPSVVFVVPSPAALGYPVAATQLITAHVRGNVLQFESHIEIAPDSLELVGLDPFGRRALTIHWRAGVLSYEMAPWLPDRIKPENILADMAIINWPEAAIRAGLASSGATVEASLAHRTIVAGGRVIIRVDYDPAEAPPWTGTVHYRNEALDYDLDIQSVRIEE